VTYCTWLPAQNAYQMVWCFVASFLIRYGGECHVVCTFYRGLMIVLCRHVLCLYMNTTISLVFLTYCKCQIRCFHKTPLQYYNISKTSVTWYISFKFQTCLQHHIYTLVCIYMCGSPFFPHALDVEVIVPMEEVVAIITFSFSVFSYSCFLSD